jgi:hypothetical protein
LYLEWHDEAIAGEHEEALEREDTMDQIAIQSFIEGGAGRTIEELEEEGHH